MFVNVGAGLNAIILIAVFSTIIASIILSIFLRKIILIKLLKFNSPAKTVNIIYFIIFNLALLLILHLILPRLILWLVKKWLIFVLHS